MIGERGPEHIDKIRLHKARNLIVQCRPVAPWLAQGRINRRPLNRRCQRRCDVERQDLIKRLVNIQRPVVSGPGAGVHQVLDIAPRPNGLVAV